MIHRLMAYEEMRDCRYLEKLEVNKRDEMLKKYFLECKKIKLEVISISFVGYKNYGAALYDVNVNEL